MPVWKSQPELRITITHSATNYDFSQGYVSTVVRRHENGFDTGTITLEDTEARNYVDKVAAGDTIAVDQRDKSESWVTILNGVNRRVEPILTLDGNFLKLECDGAGYGFMMTSCGQQYGTQSTNPTLDTIKEVVEDSTNGIVPKWVNKVLGTATDSGYAYTTQVETITGSMQYLYFPFKTCDKTLSDLCDIVQGIKGTSAGPHWIVDTASRLLIATVGNHGAPASTYWPTWWRTNADGSTLTEGIDFLNFNFQQLAKETNYVLYCGKLKKPGDGDFWTENQSGLWDSVGGTTLYNYTSDKKMGSYALLGRAAAPNQVWYWYPSGRNAGWNITAWGGKHNISTFNTYINQNNTGTYIVILFCTDSGNYYRHRMLSADLTAGQWYHKALSVGPYSAIEQWEIVGAPSWSNINSIELYADAAASGNADLTIDGTHFLGTILRGARQSAAYSSSDPMKIKVITDDIGKDDSGIASDDSGTMARLAYAELLRGKSQPKVGTITIPIANDILPGQLIHIHAKKKSDGTFRIDANFRVTRITHSITQQEFTTQLDVTDDVTNGLPRPMSTQLNAALAAVRPEFQDRQATSIKTREVDITQSILEKSY